MKIYISYCRKSTDTEDKQVLSLEGQSSSVKEFSSNKQLHVPSEYMFSESHSAKKFSQRPIFNKIIELLKNHKADGLIAYKADRLTRNYGDLNSLSELMQMGIEIWATDFGQYTNDSNGHMMLGLNTVMAKRKIDDLSEDTRRGLRDKLARNEWPGWAPMGYLNIDSVGKISGRGYTLQKQQLLEAKNQKLRSIEPDPITGPIVKKAFEAYAYQDYSLSTLRDHLHDSGLRNRAGGKLSRTTVEFMLKNSFHYGIMRWKGELIRGNYEPLISKDLYDMVQDRLSGKAPYKPRSYKLDFLYKGLMQCGECGCSITAENHNKNQKNGNHHHYTYYRCAKSKGKCSQGYIDEKLLEKELANIFTKFWLSSSQQIKLESKLKDLFKEDIEYQEGQQKTLNAHLTKLQAEKKRLYRSMAIGEMDDHKVYLEVKNDITQEISDIEESLSNIAQHTNDWLSQASNLLALSSNAGQIFLEGTKEEKQTLLHCVASNLYLKDKKISFNLKEPFNLLSDAQNCTTLLPR